MTTPPAALLTTGSVAAFLSLAVIQRYAFYRRDYARFVVAVVVVAIVVANAASFLGLPEAASGIGTAIVAATAACYALARAFANVPRRNAWLAEAALDPLVLAPPFEGRWRVAAGGPNPGDNHHLVASDQRFAYDFMRADGASPGTPILAPIAGLVVGACDGRPDHPASLRVFEDPQPLGNYVAIDGGRGVVFLCHLERGSVAVRLGDEVAAGTAIGRCGNSGRTTRPHLHLHAQDIPAYAFDRARGLPIAFTRNGRADVLRLGQTLAGPAPG